MTETSLLLGLCLFETWSSDGETGAFYEESSFISSWVSDKEADGFLPEETGILSSLSTMGDLFYSISSISTSI